MSVAKIISDAEGEARMRMGIIYHVQKHMI